MIANDPSLSAQSGAIQNYNAAVDLIERNLAARATKSPISTRRVAIVSPSLPSA